MWELGFDSEKLAIDGCGVKKPKIKVNKLEELAGVKMDCEMERPLNKRLITMLKAKEL